MVACLVEPEDVLIVTRLDRLARSTRDLLNLVHKITEVGAQFRALADTRDDQSARPPASCPVSRRDFRHQHASDRYREAYLGPLACTTRR